MRLDSANRSFLAMVVVSLLLGAFVLCGALAGVVLPLMLAQASYSAGLELLSESASWLATIPFLAVVSAGLVLGGGSLIRQLLASRELARRVRRLSMPIPEQLAWATAQAGLDGRVVVIDVAYPCSFVYGLLTPRVAVSRGLIHWAAPLELRAVLEHERYHVANLDPLKLVSTRALAAALFFLPAFDYLRCRYLMGSELAADRHAIAVCGRRPLAGALLKVAHAPAWSELQIAAGIGGLLDVRIRQLETGNEPMPGALGARGTILSLAGAASVIATFLVAVFGLGGPSAIHDVTGVGLVRETLLGGLACAAPVAGAGLLAYLFVVMRLQMSLRPEAASEIGRSSGAS